MLFLCISQCILCPRQWAPQCGGWPGEQLPLPRGDGCPQSMVLRHSYGSPGGAGWGLFLWLGFWTPALNPCASLWMWRWALNGLMAEIGLAWEGAGCNLNSPSYLCASVFLSVCAVKLFIPLLNNCIIGMHGKITFFPPHVSFQTSSFQIS